MKTARRVTVAIVNMGSTTQGKKADRLVLNNPWFAESIKCFKIVA